MAERLEPEIWCPGIVPVGHPLRGGLVALWPMWEGTGNTAMDVSGNADIAAFTVAPDWVASGEGTALYFDHVNPEPYMTLAKGANLGSRSHFTLHARFTMDAVGGFDRYIYCEGGVGGGDRVELFRATWTNNIYGRVGINWTFVTVTSTVDVSSGIHTATLVRSGSTDLRLYIDGVLRDTDNTALGVDDTDSAAFIGSRQADHTDRNWHGNIQKIAVFDYALLAAEVWTIHAHPDALITPPNHLAAWAATSGGGVGGVGGSPFVGPFTGPLSGPLHRSA